MKLPRKRGEYYPENQRDNVGRSILELLWRRGRTFRHQLWEESVQLIGLEGFVSTGNGFRRRRLSESIMAFQGLHDVVGCCEFVKNLRCAKAILEGVEFFRSVGLLKK